MNISEVGDPRGTRKTNDVLAPPTGIHLAEPDKAFYKSTRREPIMLRRESPGTFEEQVIQEIEEELGRKLAIVDEFDETTFGMLIQNQHVVALAVPESGLEKLPDNIGFLSKLQILNLKGCHLERLPASIGDLSNLRTLGLKSNCLSSLPESIGKLQALRALSVTENQLSSLPDSLGELSSLRELVLAYNKLTTLPATIGRLANLQLLVVTSNELSSLPDEFGGMVYLRECYLAGNKLTQIPESFGQLRNLRKFALDDNPLEEASVAIARKLASKGCFVSIKDDNSILKKMAELVQSGELLRNSSNDNLRTAHKATFINMVPFFEGVDATYEEDYCVSQVKLSNIKADESGIKALVTCISGYSEPGDTRDFSCSWDRMLFTASKWFILNIGTFTFHNSGMRDYDKVSALIDEANKLLGIDKTIERIDKPMDEHYWGMVGTEYMKAGRFEDAEVALKKSLELAPTSEAGWGRLVIFFNNRGRKEEALAAIENALRFAPADWAGREIMEKYRKQLAN